MQLNAESPAYRSTTGLVSLASAFHQEGIKMIVDGAVPADSEIGGCVATGGESKYLSSGCLIAPKVVLTSRHYLPAIHKVSSAKSVLDDPPFVQIRLRRPPMPGEIQYSYFHDIALLFLYDPISDVEPARMLEIPLDKEILTGRPVGYGATEASNITGYGSRLIAGLPLTIFHDDAPADPDFDPETQFMADGRTVATDACVGDSGGPFLVEHDGEYKVAGINLRASSPGALCGEGTIYLRLHPFLDWIKKTIASDGKAWP